EHLRHFDDAISAGMRPLHEGAFGPDRGASDERDVVPARVLALDGEQRVLLSATDDEAGDDVGDAHGRGGNQPGAEAPGFALGRSSAKAPFLRCARMYFAMLS